MSHRFDSGMPTPSRRLIRDGVMTHLRPLDVLEGLYVQGLIELPFPVRFTDPEDEASVDALCQGRSPCLAVAIGSRAFEGRSTDLREWSGELRIHVYAIVQHGRSIMSPVTGDVVSATNVTKDPGLETLLDHAFQRLAGAAIEIVPGQHTHLRPESEDLAFSGEMWAIWEQVYTAHFCADTNPERDNTRRVTEVEVFHDLTAGPSDRIEVTTLTTLEEP